MEAGAVHIGAAISLENGLEVCLQFKKTLDEDDFIKVIKGIKEHGEGFVIVGGNAKIHLSKKVTRLLRRNRSRFIGSVDWTPELNPIELYFNTLKVYYKRLALRTVHQRAQITPEPLINEAIAMVSNDSVREISRHGLRLWQSRRLSDALESAQLHRMKSQVSFSEA